MHSSTSSSKRLTASDRPGVAQPVPVRDVPDLPWGKVLLGALLLAVVLTGIWELRWRAFGAVPGYRDDDALWARQRRRIGDGEGDATVLIGASRTFFDIQLPVWQRLSGRRPIQLALVGTSPLSVMEDIADDPAFTGRLLVGVAPDLFFSGYETSKNLARYVRKESPSQRAGKILSMHLLEPWFAFYDPDYALFAVLRRQPWPVREGLGGLTSAQALDHRGGSKQCHVEQAHDRRAVPGARAQHLGGRLQRPAADARASRRRPAQARRADRPGGCRGNAASRTRRAGLFSCATRAPGHLSL